MALKKPIKRARNSRLAVVHPGEMLEKEFLEPLGISVAQIAKAIREPGIDELIRGERPVTAELALRLGKYLGTTAEVWMNLQSTYDLRRAANTTRLGRIKPVRIA
jgi:antitoxin HigA-1